MGYIFNDSGTLIHINKYEMIVIKQVLYMYSTMRKTQGACDRTVRTQSTVTFCIWNEKLWIGNIL